jgi:hypothetical protein
MNPLRLLAVVLVAALMSGCADEARYDEVARVASADHALEAVLSESSGGATTTFTYHVHVVAAGGAVSGNPLAILVGATRNAEAYGANLAWSGARRLEVRFLDAKSTRRDDAALATLGNGVELVLMPGLSDASAPAGGMRYNRERTGTR